MLKFMRYLSFFKLAKKLEALMVKYNFHLIFWKLHLTATKSLILFIMIPMYDDCIFYMFGWWLFTLIISYKNLVIVFIISLASSFFINSYKFSIGFISMEFPGQGKRGPLFIGSLLHIFAVWQYAASCINTNNSSFRNQSLTWSSSHFFFTLQN